MTGPVGLPPQSQEPLTISLFHTKLEPAISQTLLKFWEVEDIPCARPLSPDDEYCEKHFQSTFSRKPDGRFVVRLPFSKRESCPDSRDTAVARFLSSKKRWAHKPQLEIAYKGFMSEYIDVGHMEPAPSAIPMNMGYYFPHHAVCSTDHSKKIRVVFNASQQCRNGLSLNDLLLPGPKLQLDLPLILTRWRFHRFVIVTDIVKMFRQIEVHADDRDYQRLVWQDAPHQ